MSCLSGRLHLASWRVPNGPNHVTSHHGRRVSCKRHLAIISQCRSEGSVRCRERGSTWTHNEAFCAQGRWKMTWTQKRGKRERTDINVVANSWNIRWLKRPWLHLGELRLTGTKDDCINANLYSISYTYFYFLYISCISMTVFHKIKVTLQKFQQQV